MPRNQKNHNFPPETISGLSRNSASNFMKLIRESQRGGMALVLGAGVSVSAGLPAWPKLLRRICSAFFKHWEFELNKKRITIEKPPRDLSIAYANEIFWSEEAIMNAESFVSGDPLLVAQQIKNCIRDSDWNWLLRRALFDKDDLVQHNGNPSELIKLLSRLCALKNRKIEAVISYNYDDLFELCLKADNVRHVAIYSASMSCNRDVIPIFHPHGFLRLKGGQADSTFVLAESDYLINAATPYSWSNLVQLQTYSKYPCIFIGASMKDPALRRFLKLAQITHKNNHFAFLPVTMPINTQNIMFDALFDYDLGELGVGVIRYKLEDSSEDNHNKLLSLLETLIKTLLDKSAI